MSVTGPLELLASGRPPLAQVLARIAQHPHRVVVEDRRLADLGTGDGLDSDDLVATAGTQGAVAFAAEGDDVHLRRYGQGLRFVQAIQRVPRVSFDTHPNRFVVHFAQRLRRSLRQLPPTRDRDRALRRVDALVGALASVRPLVTASTGHPVLLHEPRYRRVLEASLTLRHL